MVIDVDLLNKLQSSARQSERKRAALCFHESPNSNAQRLLNALEPGTLIPIHRHENKSETYIIVKGRITVQFFDDDARVTDEFEIGLDLPIKGLHIPKMTWHSLSVKESSIIFEVNDGPYTPITEGSILRKISL